MMDANCMLTHTKDSKWELKRNSVVTLVCEDSVHLYLATAYMCPLIHKHTGIFINKKIQKKIDIFMITYKKHILIC